MKNSKRFIAMLLTVIMVFSVTGCGNEKSSDKAKGTTAKEAAKADISKIKTLSDALDTVCDFTEGSFKASLEAEIDKFGKLSLETEGKLEGEDCSLDSYSDKIEVRPAELAAKLNKSNDDIGIPTDTLEFSGNIKDIITKKDGRLYINLDAIIGQTLKMSTDLGYYSIPLPETDAEIKDKLQKDGREFVKGFIDAASKDLDVSAENGEFDFKFESKDDIKSVLKNSLNYLNDNTDAIVSLTKQGFQAFDVNAYLTGLLDEKSDDIAAIADAAGKKVSKEELERLKEQILNSRNSKALENEIENSDELRKEIGNTLEAFDKIDDTKWSRIYNAYKILDPEIKLTIREDGYEFKAKLNTSIEGYDIKAELKYSFEADEVNISKPEETGAKEIISYFKDNKGSFIDKLNSIKGALTANPTVSDVLDVMQKEYGGPAIAILGAGVLFPSYLKYIRKSQNSADLSNISEMMHAAEVIASDVEFEDMLTTDSEVFFIEFNAGNTATLSVNGDSRLLDAWKEIAGSDSLTLHANDLKAAEGKITGTLNANGSITWKASGSIADVLKNTRLSSRLGL